MQLTLMHAAGLRVQSANVTMVDIGSFLPLTWALEEAHIDTVVWMAARIELQPLWCADVNGPCLSGRSLVNPTKVQLPLMHGALR